ncbi:MAG: hypothetical protein U9Q34_03390 [Elusimicrobiota bacterium]|nr:hypothetical protein [Elusimicrobiota bacterium]
MKNKMKKIFMKVAAVKILIGLLLFSTQYAMASDFNLNSFSAENVYGNELSKLPMPTKDIRNNRDDMIGVQLNLRVPFGAVKKAVKNMGKSENELSIIDGNSPVISKYGENLKIKNIRIDIGGIIVEPELVVKPYLEAKNLMAVKIQKIKIHASMEPSKSLNNQQFTQEELMEKAMEAAIKGIMKSINKKFAAGNTNFKAEDMLEFKYDKAAWVLRAKINPDFIKQYVPAGLIGDVALTGFSFNDSAILIGIGTGK